MPTLNYSDRGISVCDRWRWSFDSFIDDMGPKPFKEASIDRIDVNGNYEPSNCRWASAYTQCRNKTNTVMFPFQGEMMIASDIARIAGCSYSRLHTMLKTGIKADEAVVALVRDGRYAYCC